MGVRSLGTWFSSALHFVIGCAGTILNWEYFALTLSLCQWRHRSHLIPPLRCVDDCRHLDAILSYPPWVLKKKVTAKCRVSLWVAEKQWEDSLKGQMTVVQSRSICGFFRAWAGWTRIALRCLNWITHPIGGPESGPECHALEGHLFHFLALLLTLLFDYLQVTSLSTSGSLPVDGRAILTFLWKSTLRSMGVKYAVHKVLWIECSIPAWPRISWWSDLITHMVQSL